MEGSAANMPQQHSALPTAGGILLIIAGILGLIIWAIIGFALSIIGSMAAVIPTGGEYIAGFLMICGIIGIIFSLIALIGGIMAVQRKMWGFALAGSIFGLFLIGPVFISSILSLIALILIAISKKEFH